MIVGGMWEKENGQDSSTRETRYPLRPSEVEDAEITLLDADHPRLRFRLSQKH